MDVKKMLGKRIRELRKERELSQEMLAEMIGIEANNLSRIENGKNYPSPDNLLKISNALNVTIDKLFTFYHHKDYSEIKQEIINALEDENFGRVLYKYYNLVKV